MTDKPVRIFIAVNLPTSVLAAVDASARALRHSVDADISWIKPANRHITLQFLGDIPPDRIPKVIAALNSIPLPAAFDVHASDINAFPSMNAPRIIWAGLDTGETHMHALALAIRTALADLDIPPDDKPFVSHITLGRTKSSRNQALLRRALKAATIPPHTTESLASFSLYKSTLSTAGPVYEELHRWELKPAQTSLET